MANEQPAMDRIDETVFSLKGPVAAYARAVSDNWLKILPHSNPGLIDVLRDRERLPRRNIVRWTGWFHGMHLISLVQMLRVNPDPDLREAVDWYVGQLLSLQAEDGYLGASPRGYRYLNYAPNTSGHGDICWDTSGHYYIMLGLLLWYEDTKAPEVLEAARRIGEGLCDVYLGTGRRMVATGFTETNLAPAHSLAILYRVTGEERYLALARQIVDEEFGAQGAGGEYLTGNYLNGGLEGKEFHELPTARWEGLHQMLAMVELYYITGDERYRNVIVHFWWSILRTDRHNTGGFSTDEVAIGSPYEYGPIETCCTVAWISYGVEVLRLTGDSIVADELELSTLNSVIGMHSESGFWCTYDTPMDGIRESSTQHAPFQARTGSPHTTCCTVHSPRGFGLISDWALMSHEGGVALNYYGPGTIETTLDDGTNVTVRQNTDYPRTGRIVIDVSVSNERELSLRLRIPYWSLNTRLAVGGEEGARVTAGSYHEIRRSWKGTVSIELELDMSLHLWAGELACAGKASVYRGPTLLTFDRRFNDVDPVDLPELDAKQLDGRLVDADHWLPPMVLYEIDTSVGPVRLCDFGSAGEGGYPYHSWLRMRNVPRTHFSRGNPLRSARP